MFTLSYPAEVHFSEIFIFGIYTLSVIRQAIDIYGVCSLE